MDETTAPLNILHARCPHCGRVFRGQRSSLSLQEHITSIHAVVVPSSKSNMASSPSSTRSSDAIVGQTESDNPFVCSKCKASFAQKDHLDKHELLHSAQGQFCHQCNKSFANVYRLQRHMLSHDQSQVLRKFKCPECFKAFKFKHHLKEHIRIHSGEKPFACPNCAKRFSHSGSYSSHMTSKKCLVVNLKVRKVDQIRNQRNRNTNVVNNGLSSQKCITKLDLLANSSESASNLKNSLNSNRNNKRDDSFDISSKRNLSVVKTELNDNFAPVFLTSDIGRCIGEGSSFHNYVPNNYSSGLSCLHPALFSAAAASVGLPTHYLSSTLSNYPEVANAILRSQMDISVKDIGLNRNNCLADNKHNSMKILENNTVLENYDLTSMKKILQIVDSKVTKSRFDSMNVINNGSYGELRSSNPSPLTVSAASLPLPQITPIDSPEDKSLSNSQIYLCCRYCNECFESKTDLYQHQNHVCKHRISSIIKSSDKNCNEMYNKTHQTSNTINSSAAESDDESQRDSSSLEEEVMISDGKKVRVRSVLGEETLRILRAQYDINPRPKKHEILRLAQEVNYSPRVVQVWFQNMRARDRRLGKPITSVQVSSGLSPQNPTVVTTFSPSHHSTHSIPTSLMPISIPHYKPVSNICLSENMPFSPNITSLEPDLNSFPQFGQRIANNSVYYLNSLEFSLNDSKSKSKTFSNRSENSCPTDEPLDLSLRKRSYIEELDERTESDPKYKAIEVLNLSQKSSRSQMNENSNEEMPSNVSLALIQQQRKELEKTSIVRSMLMNTCPSNGLDSPISHLNVSNASNDLQSPERLTKCSPLVRDVLKESGHHISKRHHSDSEDVEHQSDSNNLSDDCSASRTKHSMSSPSKLLKTNNDVIYDDQSPPPDINSQTDGTGLFTCDQCDKTFSKQSSLARHKYEHSGQRPHKCDVCSKAFKHKHHLTEHKRLHSGEKPFQCKKCLKRFSHSGSYSQHMNHRYSYCKPYRE